MFQYVIISFLLALTSVAGQTTNVDQCKFNRGDLPLNVFVKGCVDPPCRLPLLQDVVVNVTFIAPRYISAMRTLTTAYVRIGIFSIPIAMNLGSLAVTCDSLTNTQCPLREDQLVLLTLRMFADASIPVGTTAMVELVVADLSNGFQEPLLCVQAPVIFVAPVTWT